MHRNVKLNSKIKSVTLLDENGNTRTIWKCEKGDTLQNSKLVSVSSDKAIRIYSLMNGKCLKSINQGHCKSIRCVLYLPITNEVATGGDRLDNSIKLWSLNPQDFANCTRKLNGHTSGINCLLLIPNTCNLISGSQDYTIKVWNLLTGQILKTLLGHNGWIQNLLYLPKNHTLRSSDAYGIDYDQIKFWNLDTGECLKSCRINSNISESCTAFLSSGILVSACTDWKIYLNDDDKVLNVLEGHQWSVLCLLVLPNGNLLSGSADKTIRLWGDLTDLNKTKCLKILKGHRGKQYYE
jgi:hypothetical protein